MRNPVGVSRARWNAISQAIAQDAENIRALARIAEIHERRLTHLEDPDQP